MPIDGEAAAPGALRRHHGGFLLSAEAICDQEEASILTVFDDPFEPRLGRQRVRGSKRSRRYLGRVLAAAHLARGASRSGKRSASGFSGSRMGRGAGIGRLLGARTPGNRFARRVVVKASIVRLGGKGAGRAAAHLRYLQRDGTTRTGERGTLYSRDSEGASGTAFGARGEGDRHQFRFIVSPEDGAQYDDLKPLTRRLMAQIEEDLETRLDWIAVDHFNTGHPHTHIVLRGVDGEGRDLVIARDYLTRGIRARAGDLATLDLGPRTQREINRTLRAEMTQERLTAIDRTLIREAGTDRVVTAHSHESIAQSARVGRLAKLVRMDLAEPLGAGRFRLADGLAQTLTRMGERGDIIRTMQRALTSAGVARPARDQIIFDPASPDARPLVGRVVAAGLADEHADRQFLIVDAIDGRSHYIDCGALLASDIMPSADGQKRPTGAIVRVESSAIAPRAVDRTIAAIAAANRGFYDQTAHRLRDPEASDDFIRAHVRRLEAMRRQSHLVERSPEGRWSIAPDHLDRVQQWQDGEGRKRPVALTLLSAEPLDSLVTIDAPGWVDRTLVEGLSEPVRDAGFGRALLRAQAQRQRWLVEQGLAREEHGTIAWDAGLLAQLRRRAVLRVTRALAEELDRPYRETKPGALVEGVLRQSVEVGDRRYALVENAREFTLVPWRPMLAQQVGRSVTGVMRKGNVSWHVSRERAGPAIE